MNTKVLGILVSMALLSSGMLGLALEEEGDNMIASDQSNTENPDIDVPGLNENANPDSDLTGEQEENNDTTLTEIDSTNITNYILTVISVEAAYDHEVWIQATADELYSIVIQYESGDIKETNTSAVKVFMSSHEAVGRQANVTITTEGEIEITPYIFVKPTNTYVWPDDFNASDDMPYCLIEEEENYTEFRFEDLKNQPYCDYDFDDVILVFGNYQQEITEPLPPQIIEDPLNETTGTFFAFKNMSFSAVRALNNSEGPVTIEDHHTWNVCYDGGRDVHGVGRDLIEATRYEFFLFTLAWSGEYACRVDYSLVNSQNLDKVLDLYLNVSTCQGNITILQVSWGQVIKEGTSLVLDGHAGAKVFVDVALRDTANEEVFISIGENYEILPTVESPSTYTSAIDLTEEERIKSISASSKIALANSNNYCIFRPNDMDYTYNVEYVDGLSAHASAQDMLEGKVYDEYFFTLSVAQGTAYPFRVSLILAEVTALNSILEFELNLESEQGVQQILIQNGVVAKPSLELNVPVGGGDYEARVKIALRGETTTNIIMAERYVILPEFDWQNALCGNAYYAELTDGAFLKTIYASSNPSLVNDNSGKEFYPTDNEYAFSREYHDGKDVDGYWSDLLEGKIYTEYFFTLSYAGASYWCKVDYRLVQATLLDHILMFKLEIDTGSEIDEIVLIENGVIYMDSQSVIIPPSVDGTANYEVTASIALRDTFGIESVISIEEIYEVIPQP